jgi:hypothetical protein
MVYRIVFKREKMECTRARLQVELGTSSPIGYALKPARLRLRPRPNCAVFLHHHHNHGQRTHPPGAYIAEPIIGIFCAPTLYTLL